MQKEGSDGQRQMGKNEAEGRRVRRRGGGVAERIRHDSGEGRRRGKRWTGRNVPALLFEPAA